MKEEMDRGISMITFGTNQNPTATSPLPKDGRKVIGWRTNETRRIHRARCITSLRHCEIFLGRKKAVKCHVNTLKQHNFVSFSVVTDGLIQGSNCFRVF